MTAMIGPIPVSDVEPVPHGRTARRLEWQHLHPDVRALVERELGCRVVAAESQGAGFTPGFASRLTGEDGSRVFVKAASKQAQKQIAASYAEEARKLRLLPLDRLPTPELLWSHETDTWVVVGWECIEGANPVRPWRSDELELCLATLVQLSETMLQVPPGLFLVPVHEDLPTLLSGWSYVDAAFPDWPHLQEARELAVSFEHLPDAEYFVHSDARDDNFVLTDDSWAMLCDWNWPGLGPRWLDVVTLLVSAHADGHDADALLARNPLTADAPADHVDAWLAALCGFMLESDSRPVPASSPALGVHRRWWAAATWAWLAERRGWT
jgi:hypothetical protein